MKLLVGAMVLAVRAWRFGIAPLLPPMCRFEPSCSRYAEEALRRHGVLRGTRLTVGRLLRCRPGCPGGQDPVPD